MMRLRYAIVFAALAAGTTLLVTGCQGAVQKPDPVEPDPAPPPPTVLGTWKATSGWYEDSHVGIRKHTLVFTPDRAIETVVHVCEVEVCPEDADWTWSGTWMTDGSTITRTWLEDEQLVSVHKEFHFLADGDMMVMSPPWDNDDPDYEPMDYEFSRYTRVAPPDPAQLFGVWKGTEQWNERTYTNTITITITQDRFVYAELRVGPDGSWMRTISGTVSVDIDNLFVLQTVNGVEQLEDGELVETPEWLQSLIGDTLRWGVAPTSSPGRLFISPYNSEHQYDADTMAWQDTNRYFPFGDYRLHVEKQ